ncbi:MAG: TerB family tellurite resistance protein [Pseudomonadota bacterium]
MSIWNRIGEAVAGLIARGEALSAYFDGSRANPEKSVAFTIAVVSLGAKMAKADGRVQPSEVAAFREVFHIAPEDEASAARVFNFARQDIAGFETYASSIARMFRDQPQILEDILEGLFTIALADGVYHEGEEGFLVRVGRIFSISDSSFNCIEERYVNNRPRDPWQVLGVRRDADLETIRQRWRELVRENHPDKMIARGLPEETIALANSRIASINQAWDEISTRYDARQVAS